ncbi:alpha/beta fold hydrolase [Ideonella sp. DXS29W]|uniref:Alpha/beta fold hydrolase n=1 Tax=Ideonella lacteola TaxID=2984193 RepID=A0ABU9BM47_9BURK
MKQQRAESWGAARRAGLAWGLALCTLAGAGPAPAAEPALALKPCRLRGVDHEAQCGVLRRPLDPARADGPQIDIHVAVLPAIARNKKPDPVLFFAGGPGQSAIGAAQAVSRVLGRFLNRRDVILIDQRGTGRSAPLNCEVDAPTKPIAEAINQGRQTSMLQACRDSLQKLPYGDLRQFTTTIAMADADAVRRALGAEKVNVMGGSYGTRAVLEYMRQFPGQVRRAIIDGVAPPDMALPGSFSPDAQRAFDALLAACEGPQADATCRQRYPQLRSQWAAVLAAMPREVVVPHPVTGREERFVLTRDMLVGLVRLPLYVPSLASALPYAISEAAAGRYGAIVGLATSMGGNSRGIDLAMGMHFSVVCAEDMPRLGKTADKPGADFGDAALTQYRDACAIWPKATVPEAFYSIPPAQAATLVLSGGDDPVTPPRHGERVAKALGAKARHVVVAHAGHGTMAIGCMRDVMFRFIDTDAESEALNAVQKDAECASSLPRPPAFAMPLPVAASAPPPAPAASAPVPHRRPGPDDAPSSKADR